MLIGTFAFGANTNCTNSPSAEKSIEEGTLKIEMPDGTVTLQYTGNPDFGCCGEIIHIKGGTSERMWSFPVYGNGHYLFTMSGNTTDMDLIIQTLEAIFEINIA